MADISTVLFDFDGTVMDTNNVIIGSWQHTFKTVEGKERDEAEIIKTFGEPLIDTMKKFFPDYPTEEAVEIYRSYHRDRFTELIDIFPGIKKLLSKLKRRGYKTAIVTSRLKTTTMLGMEKYGIDKYFDAVITCEDTDKHKPDPEPVNIALQRLNSLPEEAVMLGDSMFDIMCAHNAGVKSILVGWALAVSEEEKSGPNGPDYIIESPDELFDILSH